MITNNLKPISLNLKMGSTDDLHPAFCFRYLISGYNLNNLLLSGTEYVKNFLNKIDMLSKLSWKEIEKNSRYKNGTEIIDSKSIKKELPKTITLDMNILSFHLNGLFRLIGVRDGKIFYVLFIDTKGEIYKH